MIGRNPGKYWRTCWGILTPIIMIVVLFYTLISYKPLKYKTTTYPPTAYGTCSITFDESSEKITTLKKCYFQLSLKIQTKKIAFIQKKCSKFSVIFRSISLFTNFVSWIFNHFFLHITSHRQQSVGRYQRWACFNYHCGSSSLW